MGKDVGMAQVQVVRVYDQPRRLATEYRVLVDRLWPRGVRKEAIDVDEWAKDVAPSSELRRWYGHRPELFDQFANRYAAELARPPADLVLESLRQRSQRRSLVLLTATRDVDHSAAAVLLNLLAEA